MLCSPVEDESQRSYSAAQLNTILGRLFEQINYLQVALSEMYKFIKELRDISSKLNLHAEELQSSDIQIWKGRVGEHEINNARDNSQKWWRSTKKNRRIL